MRKHQDVAGQIWVRLQKVFEPHFVEITRQNRRWGTVDPNSDYSANRVRRDPTPFVVLTSRAEHRQGGAWCKNIDIHICPKPMLLALD
jgi:hypothetical protein